MMQALYDRKADEAGGSTNFAADLANAIAAVELTDVMDEDDPFRKVEQQVSLGPNLNYAAEMTVPCQPLLLPPT